MNRIARPIALAIVVGLPARGAAAQPSPPSRFRGSSFVLARFSTTGTLAAYGASGAGPVAALVGVVHNPRTGARVVMGGLGTRARLSARAHLSMFGALAGGTGGATVRLYVLPAARFGRWVLTGTATAQLPLAATSRWKASLDPLAFSYRISSGLGVGVATVVRRQATGTVAVGGGPAASWRLFGVSTRGGLVRVSGSGRFEGHVSTTIPF
jgi:hypothetical protein